MTMLQTIIFAIIQGISELFPVSSVAHGVLTPYVFHWDLSPEFLKENFLSYVVMLHVGTAAALLIFFWRDWVDLFSSLVQKEKLEQRRIFALVVAATIPAAIIGAVLEKPLTHVFGNVVSASIFLILNGFFLYLGEKSRSGGTKEIKELNYRQALVIGLFQSLALLPGFSRSGASMTAGFWMGLKHEAAAKFSMLLATPIIAGAAVLEIPKLAKSHVHGLFQMSLFGGLLAGIFAFISVWFLMKWVKKHEVDAMRPFAYYCWIVGIAVLISRFV